jgi:hypothetical protein
VSYGLVPYACDIYALRRSVGIGVPLGDAILAKIRERQRWPIESHDKWFAERIAAGAPTMDRALSSLVLGPRLDGRHAWVFGYALQILTQETGHRLDNSMVYPASLAFLDAIDAGLGHIGIPEPFRMSRLAFSGAPVKLPRIEDFPAIGWIESRAVTAARDAFAEAKIDPQDPALSTPVRMALGEIQAWTVQAKGRGLVGFYF